MRKIFRSQCRAEDIRELLKSPDKGQLVAPLTKSKYDKKRATLSPPGGVGQKCNTTAKIPLFKAAIVYIVHKKEQEQQDQLTSVIG